MDERSEREFEVVVKPGFLVTMACLVVVYAFFHALITRRLDQPAALLESLNWGAAVTVLILLGSLLHELGHVAAGLASGHRWTGAILNGAGLGVVIQPTPFGWDRVLRSVAGPLAHLLFALPLLAVAVLGASDGRLTVAAAQTSVWWVGGVSSLFLALVNSLPMPGLDGAKVLTGLRELWGSRAAARRPAPIERFAAPSGGAAPSVAE